ncbi:transposable element Tcb2 transposase [Trichonephila clavipes]|nr:transposable element Tcb2 transposase [Trichonephila clavipes]
MRSFLSRNRSSWAAEQFHSDSSLEAVDRQAPNNSKNWQWTTEGFPSRQTIDGCVCNGFMSTEPGKLIGTKLASQMNQASICGTMMAAFALDTMPVNAALQSIHGAIFQQDNARPHVAKIVPDFCPAQHIQLIPWPAYSPDMSPIEHVWDLVGQRLARDPRPAA